MTRILPLFFLLLLCACASPAAQQQAEQAAARDAALQAQVARIEAQLEQLLIQLRSDPKFLPGVTIIPPLRVTPIDNPHGDEIDQYQALIEMLKAQALEGMTAPQGSELRKAKLQAMSQPDFGPGFVSASPEITIGKVEGDTITLNVATTNPIGGSTVHHFELKKVDGVWVGSFVGSTEYL
jgi:hypothetical protein